MKDENKIQLFEEELRKYKHRVGYKINESPKYRPLVGMEEVYDEMPVIANESGEQEDAPKPSGGEAPVAPSNDQPFESKPSNSPVPAFDEPTNDEMSSNDMPAPETAMQKPEPEQMVDDIQNEIIKHNIEAMKSIHDELKNLTDMTHSLDNKLKELTADVQEVREPTNSEKLMNKTKVSYPYYFNLNDLWSGNWFSQQSEHELSKGIRELPDGTYVADFDNLPQQSKSDIQNSFNNIS